ncbi:uncharacterized protein LOC121808714 [Salvia splendens]|uniref:uncharacterized protein LOC121808714 n=1 Tax=Salvia splendens TaxID=180675 RepID=UPI001C2770BC|nr:uncharacterized protein LOC121808714 [Salvia splendens]
MEERRLVAEIKKTAKTGNEAATKILARQLVRLRQQITNLQGSRAQMRGVETHTQALYASTSISTGMKGATKAMSAMNKQMQPAKQTKMIREFQQQAAQMDMTIEMMSDAIDETLDKDEAEEETEELTNQVLDEIGVDIASQLSSAPKGHIASKKVENTAPSAAVSTDDVEDLEKRLACLRRNLTNPVQLDLWIKTESLQPVCPKSSPLRDISHLQNLQKILSFLKTENITTKSNPIAIALGLDMQSQVVCSGCRTVLLYPSGATNVCCAICNMVTSVPPPGMEMAQLICGGCRTLLMHARGATSVRCSCCHTVNLVPAAVPPNNVAHVNCGNCHTMLMYPAGAPSVKCAICHFITNVNMGDTRVPIPVNRPAGNSNSAPTQSTSTVTTAHSHNQTVVVQNPMTVDESGKLVSNVVVGVTT